MMRGAGLLNSLVEAGGAFASAFWRTAGEEDLKGSSACSFEISDAVTPDR